MPRRSQADVDDSRARTVEAAVDMASVDGLGGVTLGRLADELGMSKSGLIGRFGDKEAMQRAVLGAAVARFRAAVYLPAQDAAPGLPRLERIIDLWIDHLRDGVFPGGCFVTTASVEFDAKPGPLRDEVAAVVRQWLEALATEVRRAGESGGPAPGHDPADVAFTLHGLASGGGVAARLLDDPDGLERTRAAMRAVAGLPACPGLP